MMKNIGATLALYPMPLIVVGVMAEDSPNWLLVGHVGIIGHDRVMVSLATPHYSNKWIKESKVLSVNLVSKEILAGADYVGSVSGNKVDKSGVFGYHIGDNGAPIIYKSPVVMECSVDDIYTSPGFESFILKIDNTYVNEEYLDDNGKINYEVLKPVLFEFPTYKYLETGNVIGNCLKLDKETIKTIEEDK